MNRTPKSIVTLILISLIVFLVTSCVTVEERLSKRQKALDSLTAKIEQAGKIAIVPVMNPITNDSPRVSNDPNNFADWKPLSFEMFTASFVGVDPRTGKLTETPVLANLVKSAIQKGLAGIISAIAGDGAKQDVAPFGRRADRSTYNEVLHRASKKMESVLGDKCFITTKGNEGDADLIVYIDLSGSYNASQYIDNRAGKVTYSLFLSQSLFVGFYDPGTKVYIRPQDSSIGTETEWIGVGDSDSFTYVSADTFTSNFNRWLYDFFDPDKEVFSAGFEESVNAWYSEFSSGTAVIR